VNAPENDPLVHRAIDELRRLPPMDRAAVERVVRAAAEARVTPADEPVMAERSRARSVRVWSALGMAAAAAIVGFVARGEWVGRRERPTQPSAAVASPTQLPALRSVTDNPSDVAAIPQQFVFENAKAKRISLVGDFNKWDPSVTLMSKTGAGLWSVIVPIFPGRHIYGFMVDDSVFTLDPRAQKARDPDLGTEGSVRMVGRP
jgi:Glycogen recognition site of AMP-activated protein kinase